VSIGQTLGVAAIASAIWFQSQSVEDQLGALFFLMLQQSFNILNAVVRIFPTERSVTSRPYSLFCSCARADNFNPQEFDDAGAVKRVVSCIIVLFGQDLEVSHASDVFIFVNSSGSCGGDLHVFRENG
jgi:hypothetical protein